MQPIRVADAAADRCRLNREVATLGAAPTVYCNEGAMSRAFKLCPTRPHTVHVDGSLQVPVTRSLRRNVRALLRHGERRLVLDLAAVPRIDAAGIAELVRTFNMTAAVSGTLRVVNATAWVRQMLERARLFDVLTAEREVEQRLA